MLTKTFALISWHLSIHVFPNNLIPQPWNIHLWRGEGSPKPVKTGIRISQASRISPFFCYLFSVICDPPSPQCPLCCVRSWRALFMSSCCLATLNLSGLIQFFRLQRLVCYHLNSWDFFPPLGGTLMITPHTPDLCRGNSALSRANTATLLLPAACRSRSQLGSPTTSGTVPRPPVQAGSSAPLWGRTSPRPPPWSTEDGNITSQPGDSWRTIGRPVQAATLARTGTPTTTTTSLTRGERTPW